MRVLLDTNVLASAAATRGLCEDVFREVLAEHELVVCSQILSELRRILRDKFRMPRELIDKFVELLFQDAVYSKPKDVPKLDIRDKDDLGILAAAKNAKASVIVTGDKELQSVGEFEGIRILSPREFWQKLTSE